MKVENLYTTVAHTVPTILVAAPSVIFVAGWAQAGIFTASVIGGVAGAMAMLGIGWPGIRNRGKDQETKRWKEEGGNPTIRKLRHGNQAVGKARKGKIYELITHLEGQIPSEEEERWEPTKADDKWADAVSRLCKHGLADERLQNKNRVYGMMRNAHAVKGIGVTTAIGGMMALMYSHLTGTVGSLGWIAAESVMLVIWIFGITKEGVRRADEAYAEAIFDLGK